MLASAYECDCEMSAKRRILCVIEYEPPHYSNFKQISKSFNYLSYARERERRFLNSIRTHIRQFIRMFRITIENARYIGFVRKKDA